MTMDYNQTTKALCTEEECSRCLTCNSYCPCQGAAWCFKCQTWHDKDGCGNASNKATTNRDEYTPSNHPIHYNQHPAGVECIDIIEGYSYNIGNAMKYLWRAGLKGSALDDLRKAKVSIEREIAMLEKRLPSIREIRGIMADVRAAADASPRQLGVPATVAMANEQGGVEREEEGQHQCLIFQEHPRHMWGHRDFGEVECPGAGCRNLGEHPAHYSERSATECPGRAYIT